jgi:hypothetical protein
MTIVVITLKKVVKKEEEVKLTINICDKIIFLYKTKYFLIIVFTFYKFIKVEYSHLILSYFILHK